MRRHLTLTGIAAVLALLAGTPLAAAAATDARSAPAVTRYFALDGSGSHLLYAAKKTVKQYDGTGGTRYVLDAKGHRTTVPAGYTAYLVGDDPLLRRQVVGPDGVTDVLWQRPDHRTEGRLSVPEGSTIESAAPDGWIIGTPVGEQDYQPVVQLRRVFTDGSMVDLGTPIPSGAPFTLIAAPSGLLVVSEFGDGGDRVSDGTVQFMRWSQPGTYRTLYPVAGKKAVRGTAFYCGDSSSTLFLCNIEGNETVARLLHLDGSGAPLAHYRCTYGPAVRTFALAWVDSASGSGCRAGRVEQVTTDGKRTVSTRTYNPGQQAVSALGKLVVATPSQRHLVAISGPTSTPKQIVG